MMELNEIEALLESVLGDDWDYEVSEDGRGYLATQEIPLDDINLEGDSSVTLTIELSSHNDCCFSAIFDEVEITYESLSLLNDFNASDAGFKAFIDEYLYLVADEHVASAKDLADFYSMQMMLLKSNADDVLQDLVNLIET